MCLFKLSSVFAVLLMLTSTCKSRITPSSATSASDNSNANYESLVKQYFTELSSGTCSVSELPEIMLNNNPNFYSDEDWQHFLEFGNYYTLKNNFVSGTEILQMATLDYSKQTIVDTTCKNIEGDLCVLFAEQSDTFFASYRQNTQGLISKRVIDDFNKTVEQGKSLLDKAKSHLNNARVKSKYEWSEYAASYLGFLHRTLSRGKMTEIYGKYNDKDKSASDFYAISDDAGDLFELTLASSAYEKAFKELAGPVSLYIDYIQSEESDRTKIRSYNEVIDAVKQNIEMLKEPTDDPVEANSRKIQQSNETTFMGNMEKEIKKIEESIKLRDFSQFSASHIEFAKAWLEYKEKNSFFIKDSSRSDMLREIIKLSAKSSIFPNLEIFHNLRVRLLTLARLYRDNPLPLLTLNDLHINFLTARSHFFYAYKPGNSTGKNFNYASYTEDAKILPFYRDILPSHKLQNFRIFDQLKLDKNITILITENFAGSETTAGFYTHLKDESHKLDIKIVRVMNKDLSDHEAEKSIAEKFNLKKILTPNFTCMVKNPQLMTELPQKIHDFEIYTR